MTASETRCEICGRYRSEPHHKECPENVILPVEFEALGTADTD